MTDTAIAAHSSVTDARLQVAAMASDAPATVEPARPAVKPYLTIRATSGWAALNIRELWQFRDLTLTLAGRDLKVRYKQTFLGVSWVILQPLLGAGIFSFVFGKVAKLPSDGIPYFLFSYAGLLCWNLFNNTIGKASASMTGNAQLISKVYFPRLVLPISSIYSNMVDFAVAMGMMIVLLFVYHIRPGWGLLLLPLWVFLTVLLAMGLGLIAGSLMVSYRDVGYVLPVATQLLMYGSPVAYAASVVPENLRTIYFLNPLSGLLEAFRWSLLNVGDFRWAAVALSCVFSVLVFLAGALMFKRMERSFVDII